MANNRNRYLSDDAEDFTVSSRESIIGIFNDLAAGNITLSGMFNSGSEVLLTVVIGVDAGAGAIYLDVNANEERNQQFLKAARVVFMAQANGAKIQWTSFDIAADNYQGYRVFRIPLPETLQRVQRRSAFRISTPMVNPVMCEVPVSPEHTLTVPLVDLCVEGCGVILPDPPEPAIQKNAEFSGCRLMHEEFLVEGLTLAVQSIWTVTLKNGQPSHRAGLEFVDMRRQDEPLIQRFVYALERRRITTLKGH